MASLTLTIRLPMSGAPLTSIPDVACDGPAGKRKSRLTDAERPKQRCGRLKDKYGLSCQIIPSILSKLLQDEGSDEVEAGHARDAADGQDRHQAPAAGLRSGIVAFSLGRLVRPRFRAGRWPARSPHASAAVAPAGATPARGRSRIPSAPATCRRPP